MPVSLGGGSRNRSPRSTSVPTLTGRELQVLRRVVDLKTNKVIAQELGITAKTVEFHVSKLLKKHGAGSRFELTDMLTPSDQDAAEEELPADVTERVAEPGEAVVLQGPVTEAETTPGARLSARSHLGRVAWIMIRPDLGFPYLLAQPDLLTPAAVLGGSAILLAMAMNPLVLPAATPVAAAVNVASALIIACMTWLLIAGPLHVIGRSISGGHTTTAVLSVMGYALLPGAMRTALRGAGVLLSGGSAADPGAIVHAPASWPLWTQEILSTLNAFNLWTVVLVFFAASAVLGLDRRRSIVTCASLSLFSFGVQWGLFALVLPA
jgi:DNA-binding CsgD family transcriptional regulator